MTKSRKVNIDFNLFYYHWGNILNYYLLNLGFIIVFFIGSLRFHRQLVFVANNAEELNPFVASPVYLVSKLIEVGLAQPLYYNFIYLLIFIPVLGVLSFLFVLLKKKRINYILQLANSILVLGFSMIGMIVSIDKEVDVTYGVFIALLFSIFVIKNSVICLVKSQKKLIAIERVMKTLICVLLCILSLFPFYIMIINSSRTSTAIQQGLSLIPSDRFIINYKNLIQRANGVGTPLIQSMFNSFKIALPTTILALYFASLTAYGIHTYRFRLRRFAWSFILAVMMIPSQVSIIGFFQFMLKLGLNDSYLPLILPAMAAPATVFFMRQFMKASLPVDIVEAARIDGSGEFRTFNRIALPLLKPALATQAIFIFIGSWNNLFTPSMILSSSSKYTLPMFVQILRTEQFRSDYGVIYTGLLLTVLPLLVVYFLLSKYIIAGVALGGVKE